MEAKEEETICSKKLTVSNSTGNVNTEKHPLDISVSGFSGVVGQKPGVVDQGGMGCEEMEFRKAQSIRRKKKVRGSQILRTLWRVSHGDA